MSNLKRAERKIRQFNAILDDGATQHQSYMYQREYLQRHKDKGNSAPHWFYFYPSKAQQERWGK
jgi:hypothetical protein